MKTSRNTLIVTGLLLFTLVLGACNTDSGTNAPATVDTTTGTEVDATATPDLTDTDAMTDTTDMDSGDVMTDTETMTDTDTMTDTETMTDTTDMDGSGVITDTDTMTDTTDMDSGNVMTETETMTDTTSMNSSDGMVSDRMGFAGATEESVVASTLMGYSIENSADENLGSVEDLVVNLESGEIKYVVVSFGGFLGLGDTYYAVPPSAFNWFPETAERNARLTIEITEAELTDAPVFSYDDDLNVVDWDADTRAYWDTRMGTMSDMDAETENMHMGFVGAEGQNVAASTLMGHGIENSADENLGSIEDLVVSLASREIHYVIVSFGGFLGLGDTYYAVPPQDFNWIPATAEFSERLTIDITEAELTDAPVFSYDDDLNLVGWDNDIRTYWDTRRGN